MADREPQGKTEVSVGDCRTGIGEFALRAGLGGERIKITRYGKPIAVIVSLADLAKLEQETAA